MTDWEKLVKLINHVSEGHIINLMQPGGAEELADYLIANGVTVKEWISVKDRLPRVNVGVLVYTPRLKNIFEVFYKEDGKWEIVSYRGGETLNDEVTHWTPLPEPPKEEERETAEWE